MKLLGLVGVLLLAVVASGEAREDTEFSLVEAGVAMPSGEFTICLKDREMMCLAPAVGADRKQDGVSLGLADRLKTEGQKFRLDGGYLSFADSADRVIAIEHGAQQSAEGRVWVWKRAAEGSAMVDQQWLANEDLKTGSAQICMRAFPTACLHTTFPAANAVALTTSGKTEWVVRPVKPCAESPCDANAACKELESGLAQCTCNAGFNLGVDKKCYEVDLCANPATNPCDAHATCAKTAPAKASCTCHNGFEGKGFKGECKQKDLCKAKPSPCDANADCVMKGPNQPVCTCKTGFAATGPNSCGEIDLCATANPCANTATCTKTGPGLASCQCLPGYSGNGQQCTVIDGCAGTPCGAHAQCLRRPAGAHQCQCDKGFEEDKKSTKLFKCIEVDNCAAKPGPCKGKNTVCKKSGPGAHACECVAGHLKFASGDCFKPGSKEATAAGTVDASDAANQELIIQQRRAKEAETQRKEMEREHRRKAKEAEENIRALERRIRELIRERTNGEGLKRDTRVSALSDRIGQLTAQQNEAAKTAALQIKLIKTLESNEALKVKRLQTELEAASKKIADAAKKYAAKLRDSTRHEIAAKHAAAAADLAAAEKAAAKPEPKVTAPVVPKTPAAPPRYGDQYSTAPLKLPIHRPAGTGQAHTPAASPAPATPAPAPAPKAEVPVTANAPAPKPVTNEPAAAARFAQVHAEAEAEAEAMTEAEAHAEAEAEMEVDVTASESVEADVARDLDADLAAMEHSDVEQSDEDLAEQLAALHAEVDSHLDSVLAEEDAEVHDDAEEEEAEEEADF